MKIQTTFNIGDVVYYLNGNRIERGEVLGILVSMVNGYTNITYNISAYSAFDSIVAEGAIYKTKEEATK